MYLLSSDIFHITLASLFLIATLGVVFFRYKRHLSPNKKTVNYTTDKNLALVRIASIILSILLLSVTILEPMGLLKDLSARTEGMDCVWLLDVSLSMDTEDVTESTTAVSRLAKAKSVIENYIVAHPENRYGLVIFAGKSRLVSPLTSEHSSLLSFLASIDSKSISEGGTDFLDALTLATERFETKDNTPHAIVLLSDGGDKEDTPDTGAVRRIFQGKHASLVTVGIGQTKKSPIPIGHDPLGNIMYKKFQGETVLSWLNRGNLKDLAGIGNGSYLEGDSLWRDLEKPLGTISHRTLHGSWENATDATVRILIATSFLFLLIFILLPSSFLKQWNAS